MILPFAPFARCGDLHTSHCNPSDLYMTRVSCLIQLKLERQLPLHTHSEAWKSLRRMLMTGPDEVIPLQGCHASLRKTEHPAGVSFPRADPCRALSACMASDLRHNMLHLKSHGKAKQTRTNKSIMIWKTKKILMELLNSTKDFSLLIGEGVLLFNTLKQTNAK